MPKRTSETFREAIKESVKQAGLMISENANDIVGDDDMLRDLTISNSTQFHGRRLK